MMSNNNEFQTRPPPPPQPEEVVLIECQSKECHYKHLQAKSDRLAVECRMLVDLHQKTFGWKGHYVTWRMIKLTDPLAYDLNNVLARWERWRIATPQRTEPETQKTKTKKTSSKK